MRKVWRFFLGLLSILALLFGIVGMVSMSFYGGAVSVIGAVLLWPSIGDRVNNYLGRKWVAFALGVFFWLFMGPVVAIIAGPAQNELGSEQGSRANEKTLLGDISDEKQREAQEWWQGRQNNLQAEQERGAGEYEARAQNELKKAHRQCSDSTMAYIMSQRFVERELKAPRTAKFPSFHSSGVTVRDSGGCKFMVTAYVDSENSFGAMLRTNYSISMEYLPTEKTWRGSELRM